MGNFCSRVKESVVEAASSSLHIEPSPSTLKLQARLEEDLDKDLTRMTLAQAIQECWELDGNRLRPDIDYRLNVQKGKKPWWPEDKAPCPLFSYVNTAIWRKPTYAAFQELLDNYQAAIGSTESMEFRERQEIELFLTEIMKTGPMKFCHAFCRAHRPQLVPSDEAPFKKV
jgi:poly(U)-specific endoribonuclease